MCARTDHLTTVVGVDNVIVVTTQDAVLVLNRAHGDQVKQLVDRLKAENRPEALQHKRSYRPWGYYQSVDHGARYQVKRIVVKPGERLVAAKALPPRRTLDRREGHRRGHAQRRGRSRA